MFATILTIISGLFTAAGKLFEWLYARKLVDAGVTQQKLSDLAQQVKDAQIAVAAREAVRAAASANPDGKLPIDESDPFLRD